MRKVLTCNSLSEASILKGKLDSYGIPSFLTNQNFTTLMPIYNGMLGSGVQLMVKEEDLAAAREVLKAEIDPQSVAMVCPNCGSENITLGLGKAKKLKAWTAFLSLLAFVPMGNLKPTYNCSVCQTEIK